MKQISIKVASFSQGNQVYLNVKDIQTYGILKTRYLFQKLVCWNEIR